MVYSFALQREIPDNESYAYKIASVTPSTPTKPLSKKAAKKRVKKARKKLGKSLAALEEACLRENKEFDKMMEKVATKVEKMMSKKASIKTASVEGTGNPSGENYNTEEDDEQPREQLQIPEDVVF